MTCASFEARIARGSSGMPTPPPPPKFWIFTFPRWILKPFLSQIYARLCVQFRLSAQMVTARSTKNLRFYPACQLLFFSKVQIPFLSGTVMRTLETRLVVTIVRVQSDAVVCNSVHLSLCGNLLLRVVCDRARCKYR